MKNKTVAAIRAAIIGVLTAYLLIVGGATAFAADRVILGSPQQIPLTASGDPAIARTLSVLRRQIEKDKTARVIVGVRAAFAPEGAITAASAAQQRSDIAQMQSAVLGKVSSLRQKIHKIKQFETIPFMALEVDAAELEALAGLSEITSIEEDRLAAPTLAQSSPLIGATTAWSSYTGSGQAVAILDTGVEKTHAFLAGKVVSEACYSTNNNVFPYYSTSVCPGGVSQSTSDGSAMPYGGTCPAGECDHGTHVAGIVAGQGGSFSGVAKGASLIAVQVFTQFGASYCGGSPCALSYTSDQILGLQRVYALRGTYNIAAVNMSLGGGRYYTQTACDSDNPSIKTAIDNLRSAGIATVISSGNDGYTDSTGAPGCISSAISVGSTWDYAGYGNNCDGNDLGTSSIDEIACYSNSASFLNLLAPGSLIYSSIPGGLYANYNGTSMAAPQVAGAWAVLKQKSSGLTVNDALTALTTTGVSVTDSRNGITKKRIQVDAALNAIGGGGGTPPSAPTIGTATAGNASISVTFTPGALGTGTLVDHTADCGGFTNTGASSPITVTGLSNGTTYTCKVKTTTTAGSSPWSALSNAVMPVGVDDGFPSGGLPAGWIQPSGSNASWVVTNDTAYGGSLSLKSGIIGNSQKSEIAYTAAFSSGTVSFARKVSSEVGYDYLEFYIDGVRQNSWSGEVPWSVVSFPITAGSHTLLWRYIKDNSVANGSDAAWIDSVILPPSPPPVCSIIPVSPSMYVDVAQLFSASCTNSPTAYQWAVDGGNVAATQSTYITALPLGPHTVSVTATNAGGSGSASTPVTVNVFTPPSVPNYLIPIIQYLML